MYSKEDIDTWIAVIERIVEEAYADPDLVRTAPHRQAITRINTGPLEDPERWAMTWRAFRRKHGGS
jgi:glycine dehydrogenase subunit 2